MISGRVHRRMLDRHDDDSVRLASRTLEPLREKSTRACQEGEPIV
jgi:hypothetical protein